MIDRRNIAGLLFAALAGCAGTKPAPLSLDPPTLERRSQYPPTDVPSFEFQDAQTRNDIARMVGYFPNTLLTTHDGKEVRFYDDLVRDKCVLINFMYTACDDL